MNKSESIKNLALGLLKFNELVGKVGKDATNPFFKSKYASLPNILAAIAEPLQKSGLVFSQFPTDNNGLTTIIIHAESGEWMESTYVMPVSKQNDPQAVGSAITYARRYAISAAFGLNVDDDDDGNAASKPPAPKLAPQTSFKDIVAVIQQATSENDLNVIYRANKSMQKDPAFIEALKSRKEQIKKS